MVSRTAAVELTVNHCHFLNGYRICGAKSRRLRPVSTAPFDGSLLSRSKCTYSLPAEKYSWEPENRGRSFFVTAIRGLVPVNTDVVVLEKYSVRANVALRVYSRPPPITFAPTVRLLLDVS